MARPASTPPVKAILATSGWSTSASPVARSPVTTLTTPAGKPTSSASRAASIIEAGRHFRRLDHHGVAGGQRRRDGHDGEEQRRVPRHDHADHAERLAQRVVQHRGAVDRDDPALDLVGEAAVVVEPVGDDPRLQHHLVEELAVLRGLDPADLVGIGVDGVRPAHEEPPPPGRGYRLPLGERRLRCRHRVADIGRVAERELPPHRTRGGIVGWKRIAGRGRPVLAADPVAVARHGLVSACLEHVQLQNIKIFYLL